MPGKPFSPVVSLLISWGIPVAAGLISRIFLGVLWGMVIGTLAGLIITVRAKNFYAIFIYLLCFAGFTGYYSNTYFSFLHPTLSGWQGAGSMALLLVYVLGIVCAFVFALGGIYQFFSGVGNEKWFILYPLLTALMGFLGYEGYLPVEMGSWVFGGGINGGLLLWSMITGIGVSLFLIIFGFKQSFAVTFSNVAPETPRSVSQDPIPVPPSAPPKEDIIAANQKMKDFPGNPY